MTPSSIKNVSESRILFAIESFIIEIYQFGFREEFKSAFKELLEHFDKIYNIDYHYCDYCAVFVELKSLVDQIRYDLYCNHDWHNYNFVLDLNTEQLKEFEQLIKKRKGDVQKELVQFYAQEKYNTTSLETYASQLLEHYSKLLIVRVDLGYRNDAKHEITIDRFYRDFEKMRNRLANKDTIFKNLHGYAWALEQAVDREYHVHMLLIYDGAKVQNGSHYAMQAGEKWFEFTEGRGTYFNPHNKEYIHELKLKGCEIGLGMLSRNNDGDWERLLSVIGYFTDCSKDHQRLRVKVEKNMQTFGKGQYDTSKRRGIKTA